MLIDCLGEEEISAVVDEEAEGVAASVGVEEEEVTVVVLESLEGVGEGEDGELVVVAGVGLEVEQKS